MCESRFCFVPHKLYFKADLVWIYHFHMRSSDIHSLHIGCGVHMSRQLIFCLGTRWYPPGFLMLPVLLHSDHLVHYVEAAFHDVGSVHPSPCFNILGRKLILGHQNLEIVWQKHHNNENPTVPTTFAIFWPQETPKKKSLLAHEQYTLSVLTCGSSAALLPGWEVCPTGTSFPFPALQW